MDISLTPEEQRLVTFPKLEKYTAKDFYLLPYEPKAGLREKY